MMKSLAEDYLGEVVLPSSTNYSMKEPRRALAVDGDRIVGVVSKVRSLLKRGVLVIVVLGRHRGVPETETYGKIDLYDY